ncbi:MAG TPA: inositol monophosphatase family protein [Acidisphaera sp.]|nr:inositol monophosphatase family protein [Acidisphaera sp.]
MTEDDVAALAAILADAGRREIMPRFRALGPGDIRTKSGPTDFVTVADEAAERAIAAALLRRYPGALIVGEEAAAADPSLLPLRGDAALAFVVDPIDGTFNYQAGLPLFGSMVAAIEHGEITAAAIHDPVIGDTACALAGQGAWLDGPSGRRMLRVAASVPVERMAGMASWMYLHEPERTRVVAGLAHVSAAWSYRCAAHEYRTAAGGHCHFLLYNKLMPWDHAPGWLLHREAGGYAARFDGSPYTASVTSGGLICTPDEESWRALRAVLLDPPGD